MSSNILRNIKEQNDEITSKEVLGLVISYFINAYSHVSNSGTDL